MSRQKGTLVLFNKETNKYYTYKVEMTNGDSLKVFDREHNKIYCYVKDNKFTEVV